MILQTLKDKFSARLTDSFRDAGADLPALALQPAPQHVAAEICTPWAMSAAKKLRRPPLEIAKKAAEALSGAEEVEKAEAAPPGFINIKLKPGVLWDNAKAINAAPDSFQKQSNPSSETVQIEFVSANPTGPLHVASGRGASLGDSLVRIMRGLGMKADAEYYVNDSGNQAQLLGVSLRARKEGKEPPENGYHGDYLKELAGQVPPDAQWTDEEYSKFAIEKLLATHQRDMKDFRVEFKTWFRESVLHDSGAVKAALDKLQTLGKTYEKESAVWFGTTADSSEEGQDDKDRVLVRADGRPTYFLNDIAYHNNKYDRGYSRLIDIWGADHHGYVPRMKTAIAALGKDPASFHVIIHQMVLLLKGGEAVKMSKRAGEFITLRELIDDVGADACRFFFAARTPNSHMTFDIDLAKKKSQENPVFYVQYVHARICSIFRSAGEKGIKASALPPTYQLNKQEQELLAKLLWFQLTLETCVADMSPHHLANYLMELAGLFHPFYDSSRVLDEAAPETTAARLFLCDAVKNTIANGLDLIGVSAPEQM